MQTPREIESHEIVLIKSFGSGSFSEVLTGRWKESGRNGSELLAVKKFRDIRIEDDLTISRLERRLKQEVDGWLQAQPHPNVLPFIGIYHYDPASLPALVSPYREARDILSYISSENGRVDHCRLAIGIATGLDHLHSKKIVHGDLTPNNILIHTEGGRAIPQIADFGRAKILNEGNSIASLHFNPRYSAPELILCEAFIQTNENLLEHCDVWSLGMVLLHVLSGIQPYHGREPCHIAQSLREQRGPTFKEHHMSNCPVGRRVWPLLERCWEIEKTPQHRCSAREFLMAFKQEFPRVVDNPRNGTLERDLGDALKQDLRANEAAQRSCN